MVQHLPAGTDVEKRRPQVLNEDDLIISLSILLHREALLELQVPLKAAHRLAHLTVLSMLSYRRSLHNSRMNLRLRN